MKLANGLSIRMVPALLAVLLLAGCGDFPGAQGQQQFHPLDSEVALAAAPQQPEAPPLLCRIGRGDAHFARGWANYAQADFTLGPDSRISVSIEGKHSSDNIQILALFDAQGQKLIFCPIVDGPPDKRVACTSLYALDDDLNGGIKRTFDVPNAIRGAEITCAYKEEGLHKL